jgi:hypothetical protein
VGVLAPVVKAQTLRGLLLLQIVRAPSGLQGRACQR